MKTETCNWCGKEKECEWIVVRTEGSHAPICKECASKMDMGCPLCKDYSSPCDCETLAD